MHNGPFNLFHGRYKLAAVIALSVGMGWGSAWAADTITIKIPRHSQLSYCAAP